MPQLLGVVLEADIPVAAVAKRLVFRSTAAAQRIPPRSHTLPQRVIGELDATHPVWAILDDHDLGALRRMPVLIAVEGITERA